MRRIVRTHAEPSVAAATGNAAHGAATNPKSVTP